MPLHSRGGDLREEENEIDVRNCRHGMLVRATTRPVRLASHSAREIRAATSEQGKPQGKPLTG